MDLNPTNPPRLLAALFGRLEQQFDGASELAAQLGKYLRRGH
jgi:hypothetical protein